MQSSLVYAIESRFFDRVSFSIGVAGGVWVGGVVEILIFVLLKVNINNYLDNQNIKIYCINN